MESGIFFLPDLKLPCHPSFLSTAGKKVVKALKDQEMLEDLRKIVLTIRKAHAIDKVNEAVPLIFRLVEL